MSTILLKLQQRYKWSPKNLNIINKRHQQTRTQTKRLPRYQPIDVVPVFRRASNFTDKTALRDSFGYYTYGNLFMGAKELSNELSQTLSDGNVLNQKVLFLCGNNANYVLTQWAIWMSGHIAVPLSPLHPQNLLEYYASDSNAKLIITTLEYADLIQRVSKNCKTKLLILDEKLRQNATQMNPTKKSDMEGGLPPDFYNKSNAMILYTSGTTGKPKGVLLSHKNVVSQITCLIDAWKWTEKDTLLHTLPLHHVHGIVNALLCPQYIGAKCIMLPKFDANTVWAYLLGISNPDDRRISVFMAVPTIYSKLINEYQKVFSNDNKMVEYIHTTLKNRIRLMVSGSAPLPASIHSKWLEISGHKLLERYGMTEIGMCLSNLYDSNREPGYVGLPLPGVSVRLARKIDDGEDNYLSLLESTNVKGVVDTKLTNWDGTGDPTGELQVKGDNVFKEYYNKPHETQQEFTIDGWFKTGDVSLYSLKDKKFKLLGRQSVDIIKSGGYKISALSIETHILEHPSIADCAVVGVKDDEWGQKIVALIVLKPNIDKFNVDEFKEWARSKMPGYSVPKEVKVVTVVPKNAMGKVNKKELVQSLFG